jgi:hypothetical protein
MTGGIKEKKIYAFFPELCVYVFLSNINFIACTFSCKI